MTKVVVLLSVLVALLGLAGFAVVIGFCLYAKRSLWGAFVMILFPAISYVAQD